MVYIGKHFRMTALFFGPEVKRIYKNFIPLWTDYMSLKFTMEMKHTKLPLLDILIIKNHDVITTDLYCKYTDTQQYLDFRSCHPSHTKTNIPFNFEKRICTIVSDPKLRLNDWKNLKLIL